MCGTQLHRTELIIFALTLQTITDDVYFREGEDYRVGIRVCVYVCVLVSVL